MMKAIIISDLHANSEALRALPEKGDELWVVGDLVNYGPDPRAVVNYVREIATVAVRGNHDHAVGFDADPRCTPRYVKMAARTQAHSTASLDDYHKEFLRELPLHVEFRRDGKNLRMCHALPSDPLYGYCPAESDRWEQELDSYAADVLIVGHTHTPFVKQIRQKKVVNPGSLGQPKTGSPDACYAVWTDGEIQLKQFPYPVEKTIAQINEMSWPSDIKQDLVTVLRTGSIS
jgi:putative phosphoesterase